MSKPEKYNDLFEGPPRVKQESNLRAGHRPLHRGKYRGDHAAVTAHFLNRELLPVNLGSAENYHLVHEMAQTPHLPGELKPQPVKDLPESRAPLGKIARIRLKRARN